MSEFTNTAKTRIRLLNKYMLGIIEGESGAQLIKDLGIKTENFIPSDILGAFNLFFEASDDLEKMKMASNKLFNILFETLKAYPALKEEPKSFIDYLKRDNAIAAEKLKEIKPFIKKINQEIDKETLLELNQRFSDLEKFTWHYTVKENVLFPILETHWQEHDCLKLMWSFHDDIRKNFRKAIELTTVDTFDLKAFNKFASLLFFNISTIIFREEKVLFPLMMETLDLTLMDKMLSETNEMTLPFVKIKLTTIKPSTAEKEMKENYIQFPTGELTLEQTELVFNHLPV
ncbi:MAG: hemerythrin domain-containing protein, partial [Bacteroidales bacterium]|nr:hemerythrin domain-containing protein [Bacteroidales bacterium]